jgi:hypothetical protein
MRRRGMDAITIGGFGPIADQNDFIYIHRCPSPPKKTHCPLPRSASMVNVMIWRFEPAGHLQSLSAPFLKRVRKPARERGQYAKA